MLSAIPSTRRSMIPPASDRPSSAPSSAPLSASDADGTAHADESSSPSTLRQAALLSLRAKRRRPESEAILAPTPMAAARPLNKQPSIQLDYGQDDSVERTQQTTTGPSSTSGSSVSTPVNSQSLSTVPIPAVKPEDKDVDMREEGEISDEEELTPPPLLTPVEPPTRQSEKQRQRHRAPSSRSGPTASIPPPVPSLPPRPNSPPSAHDTPSDPLPPSLVARISMNDDMAVPPAPTSTGFENLHFPFPLDANHVRPGLTLTQEQYDTAKDIVLDLLGWGVPPEYLVDCGLSREIVFYIFSELKLRLPSNLDTNGIIPFPPPPELLQQLPENAPSPPLSLHDSDNQPSDQPSLLNRISSSASLADMEQQRKQELLARKAVQASRKRRDTLTGNGPAIEKAATLLVPQDSVDDFLSSIGSVIGSATTTGKEKEVPRDVLLTDKPRADSPQAMSVDEIPGLDGSAYLPEPPPLSSISSLDSTASTVLLPNGRTNSVSGESTPILPSVSVPAKRKRPVASDFVDEDVAASAASLSLVRSPSLANAQSHPNPHIRRRMQTEQELQSRAARGVFSTLAMPRYVIDWNSDSEDDADDVEDALAVVDGSSTRIGGLTPPAPVGTPSSTATSTASELEKKIAQMREEIRAKEELRLRRLAVASSGSGRSTPAQTPVSTASVQVHERDAGDTASANAQAHAHPAITTPPHADIRLTTDTLGGRPTASLPPTTAAPDAQGLLTAELRREQAARISPLRPTIHANPL